MIGAVAAGEQMLREGAAVAARIGDDSGVVVSSQALALVLVGQPDVARRQEARNISAQYIDKGWVGPGAAGRGRSRRRGVGVSQGPRGFLLAADRPPIYHLSVVPVRVKRGQVVSTQSALQKGGKPAVRGGERRLPMGVYTGEVAVLAGL